MAPVAAIQMRICCGTPGRRRQGWTISDSTAGLPQFTLGSPGEFRFTRVVNDGHADSVPDTEQITVTCPPGMVWVVAGSFLYGDSLNPVYLDALWDRPVQGDQRPVECLRSSSGEGDKDKAG
jgi:hypothetical protein